MHIMPTRLHVPEEQSVNIQYYSTHLRATTGTGGRGAASTKNGLPDERIVHNLEHGNIVVSYNLPQGAQLEQLKDFMDDFELAPAWAVTQLLRRDS